MTLDCGNNFVAHIVDKISLRRAPNKESYVGFFENPGERVFIN